MRVYLSGPMTGHPEYNYPLFRRVASLLREDGITVACPTELGLAPVLPWEAMMHSALQLLLQCEAIALLPGWEHSRGARLEAAIAASLQMEMVRVSEEGVFSSMTEAEREILVTMLDALRDSREAVCEAAPTAIES
ncbi:DUF4406 domain-containing protein [Alicyclobacillus sp. TC]|uniref:DUF4406 domain-containing protein n=1 Tax=Alicyclobacillus TaxID=29330 RepID=UPI001932FFC9|nr:MULTISPECIES: DUF4406 domain-containing protein [Alicyclobacillus]QRF23619.1 DUF4406 domain-containing protein [Alicyclobacillus sp. TC]